jgi:MFS family permease
MKVRGWLGLDVRIWKVASTHLVVDSYTNLYAPLLPLLIPHLDLSLATAGTLAMAFQMSNSVSQLGFGALADRWKPRALISRPLLAVVVLSFVAWPPLRSSWARSSCSAAWRRALPPAGGALVYRLADSSQGPRDVGPHLGRIARLRSRRWCSCR